MNWSHFFNRFFFWSPLGFEPGTSRKPNPLPLPLESGLKNEFWTPNILHNGFTLFNIPSSHFIQPNWVGWMCVALSLFIFSFFLASFVNRYVDYGLDWSSMSTFKMICLVSIGGLGKMTETFPHVPFFPLFLSQALGGIGWGLVIICLLQIIHTKLEAALVFSRDLWNLI